MPVIICDLGQATVTLKTFGEIKHLPSIFLQYHRHDKSFVITKLGGTLENA